MFERSVDVSGVIELQLLASARKCLSKEFFKVLLIEG